MVEYTRVLRASGRLICILILSVCVWPAAVRAQPGTELTAPTQAFTLEEALQYASDHYPTIKAALEQVTASTADVGVARAAYLPRLDAMWQANRATVNNVTGLLLPQSVIASITGPPFASASGDTVWGSAAGALFSWEPFDLGLRGASVHSAEAAVSRARADEAVTRLNVQAAVGVAFLDVVRAEQALNAADADVERRAVLGRTVHTLVDNQLRPGAEASRADAEGAAAQTRVLQARESLLLARITLTRVMGIASTGTVSVVASNLMANVPIGSPPRVAPPSHPLAQSQQTAVDLARSQEEVLAHTDRPRVYLQSNFFARGSGADTTGFVGHGSDGLWFDRGNWAAGVQVVFPNVFDFASLHARQAASAATTRAERARYDETLLAVSTQQQAATVMVEAARAVAANTPVQLDAARQGELQARARYDAGLTNIIEVADAQNLLAQADYQNALARVDVWRALFAQAIAQGTLTPFVDLMRAPAGGR
jgi:outer membrane protein